MNMYVDISTQAECDVFFAGLLEDGYPYMGKPEHNRHILLEDGSIRSEWKNDDGTWDVEDATVSTQEELAESIHCWLYDC